MPHYIVGTRISFPLFGFGVILTFVMFEFQILAVVCSSFSFSLCTLIQTVSSGANCFPVDVFLALVVEIPIIIKVRNTLAKVTQD